MKTIEEVVAQMKGEIIADVMALLVPADVSSYVELHDYRDANCYGGFCDDNGITDELIALHGGRDPVHEGMPEAVIEFMNKAMEAVDDWIKADGLRKKIDEMNWEESFTPYSYGDLLRKYKELERNMQRNARKN